MRALAPGAQVGPSRGGSDFWGCMLLLLVSRPDRSRYRQALAMNTQSRAPTQDHGNVRVAGEALAMTRRFTGARWGAIQAPAAERAWAGSWLPLFRANRVKHTSFQRACNHVFLCVCV